MTETRILERRRLGLVPYRRALHWQAQLVDRRRAGQIPDQLLLLEHPHVITLGTGAHSEHILASPELREQLKVEMVEAGRGGDVTYHGPGQLVGYPILDLKPDRKDVHRYLRDLEEVLIRVAGSYGIQGWRSPGKTGVWTEWGKLAAIGVRVSSGWITSHGFALNVATDLGYFGTIVPCGIPDQTVASLGSILQRPPAMEEVEMRVAEAFDEVFERTGVDPMPIEDLDLD